MNLAFSFTELCTYTADEGRVVDRIGQINLASGGFGCVLGSAHGDGADLAGGPANEAVDRLLGDEEGYSTAGFMPEGSLKDKGIDELHRKKKNKVSKLECLRWRGWGSWIIPDLREGQRRTAQGRSVVLSRLLWERLL